ncbi:MAG: prepilin-type N-terminal cleavage/methylation domain-containing protein, partial [Candidatus Gastranaerophilales bacterium]|nr:prepilin-type N-terminal cleavage/methylation domain-containing protein [Candidatus Gastranaerophilales bacterium]
MLKKIQESENKFIRKLGFTLAETLIVIAIIGIIASIVTPMLFGTTSDAELKAKWKKIYADLSQVTQLIVVNNGGSLNGFFEHNTDVKNAFAEKLNIIKECSDSTADGCWHEANNWHFLNGTNGTNNNKPGLILNNGVLLVLWSKSVNCSNPVGDYTRCAGMNIDINGFKKPNIVGKDIFNANITSNA